MPPLKQITSRLKQEIKITLNHTKNTTFTFLAIIYFQIVCDTETGTNLKQGENKVITCFLDLFYFLNIFFEFHFLCDTRRANSTAPPTQPSSFTQENQHHTILRLSFLGKPPLRPNAVNAHRMVRLMVKH